jgi:hypothetical protein
MDWALVTGIAAALVAFWIAMLVIFWLLRPKGVPIGDIIRVVPDVLRLLDRSSPIVPPPSTCESCWWD